MASAGSVYIAESDLAKLHKYKYCGIDKSLLSRYVLQHYWNGLVKLFPLWLAPNAITLIGFCFIVANFLTMLYYDPHLDQESPGWVYYSYGLGLWIYASLDAIDGKQARRTGTSGPLGEMFDHGCDSLNTTIGLLITSSIFGLGRTWWTVVSVWVGLCNFYLSTTEEYYTGTLYLSYISAPVEGLVLSSATFALTGYTGQGIWFQDYRSLLPLPTALHDWLPSAPLNYLVVVISVGTISLTLFDSLLNVFQARRRQGLPVAPALLSYAPFAAMSAVAYLWLAASPELLHQHLVAFFVFVTFAFGFTVGRIIVAHVTKTSFPMANVMLIPLTAGAVNANLAFYGLPCLIPMAYEKYYVYLCVVYSTLVYSHFALTVIRQICDYLDIWCLKIKHKKV
ncbi:hypothetical protein H4R35_003333 [Dimargaris xerosporica]|nr:hypothetical protein H4R35_003333 [Dimargaris xerosporica]